MHKLNVKPQYLKMLYDIFNEYCPEAEIWAYGSRLNGDSHDGSDLDLVVKSFNNPDKKLYELREILIESNIPFLIDINEFDSLPISFQQEILNSYVVLFAK